MLSDQTMKRDDRVATTTPLAIISFAKLVIYGFVFTIPLLFAEFSAKAVPANLFAIFFLTYCFIGMELIAEELEGPVDNQVSGFE